MSTIEKYILLIRQFLAGRITASQFEFSYLEVFKNEEETLPEEVYNILNVLFLDVFSVTGTVVYQQLNQQAQKLILGLQPKKI